MAEDQKNPVFRKKNLERIASPEQLTDYLRVTTPGMWAVIVLIILLLISFFSWATIGKLETTVDAKATVLDGSAWIEIDDSNAASVFSGMAVRIGEDQFILSPLEDDSKEYTLDTPVRMPNGNYDAQIILESVSPISFLLGR